MRLKSKETFSYKVKSESEKSVTGRKKSDACLIGLLLLSERAGGITLRTDSEICLELFLRLVRHASENENAAIYDVIRSRGRVPTYSVSVLDPTDIEKISQRLRISGMSDEKLLDAANGLGEKYFGTFLSGIFIACGSISSPDKEYHLELSLPTENLCGQIRQMLIERLGVNMKYTCRRGENILYLKGSEGIEDVLTFIGAPMSSLELMNVKIFKDIRNRANRATNCDTANCERQNRSSARQIAAIKIIESSEGGLSQLSDELRQIADMRLMHPEMTLSELSEEFDPPLSKSGANHRFQRIEEIARELSLRQNASGGTPKAKDTDKREE